MSVDLSIVVVHWNVPDLLEACLHSIAAASARTSLSVETLVVDTSSPDTSYRDVTRRAGVRLVEMAENRGYAAGCNAGVRESLGSAVLLLNADTVVQDDALDILWQGLHVANHVGMVAPLLLNPDGSVQSAGYRFPGVMNVLCDLFPVPGRLRESPLNGRLPVADGIQPVRADYVLGAAMLIRRDVLEAVGGLDERYGMYCEEIDLARSIGEAGWTTLVCQRARIIHVGGQSTAQRPLAMHEALWYSRARYYARWGTIRQQRAVGLVASVGLRLDDRHGSAERRAVNRRLRQVFGRLGRGRPS